MPKTPDEIKEAMLNCSPVSCRSTGCPYKADTPKYEGDMPVCRMKLWHDMKHLIQQLEAQTPRWISVEERLPERYKHVLVATRFADEGEPDLEIAYFSIGGWKKEEGHLYGKVTHWMPLPEPPKEEK